MTRIGVGGLINMDKLKQTHHVLNDIALFHYHAKQQIDNISCRLVNMELSPFSRAAVKSCVCIKVIFLCPYLFYLKSVFMNFLMHG